MSKKKGHEHKHPSPYDREFSQLNHNMFVKYGVGMEGIGHDEFHTNFQTTDVRRDSETRNLKTTALGKDGHMKERTKNSIALLEEHGLEGMDWSAWKGLMNTQATKHLDEPQTGKRYADGTTIFHDLVMTDSDPRYEASVDARYGPKVDTSGVLLPARPKTLKQPKTIAWSEFLENRRLDVMSPMHFLKEDSGVDSWPREMELELAPFLNRCWANKTLMHRAFRAASLEEWMDKEHGPDQILSFWASKTADLFVVFLIEGEDNQVTNYFYIPVDKT